MSIDASSKIVEPVRPRDCVARVVIIGKEREESKQKKGGCDGYPPPHPPRRSRTHRFNPEEED